MCLSVPAEVLFIDGETATVSINGVSCRVGLQLVEGVRPGDYVIIHSGYVLDRLDAAEAVQTLRLFEELQAVAHEVS
jgi:hydrogenase expression/formation protein HypC